MAGRYLVSGVQLGMLKALSEKDKSKFNELIEEIIENQFIGNSFDHLEKDVERLSDYFNEE